MAAAVDRSSDADLGLHVVAEAVLAQVESDRVVEERRLAAEAAERLRLQRQAARTERRAQARNRAHFRIWDTIVSAFFAAIGGVIAAFLLDLVLSIAAAITEALTNSSWRWWGHGDNSPPLMPITSWLFPVIAVIIVVVAEVRRVGRENAT